MAKTKGRERERGAALATSKHMKRKQPAAPFVRRAAEKRRRPGHQIGDHVSHREGAANAPDDALGARVAHDKVGRKGGFLEAVAVSISTPQK